MLSKHYFSLLLVSFLSVGRCQDDEGIYKVGVGIGDITGPPAGTPLNGFIGWLQAAGIYTRQYARAFAVESVTSGNVVVYITCDMGMIDHSLVEQVVLKLQRKYGDKISVKNIMISATHTHSGVSGFMTYYGFLLIESKGFNPVSYWNSVDGIYEAVDNALTSAQLGRMYYTSGVLERVNENRRREGAYMRNPQWERDLYNTTVDVVMDLLKFETLDSIPLGAFNWFAVHPGDFNEGGDNPLVSSDHKGYASLLFDYKMNPGKRPGQGAFVSGFGSANLGGVYTSWEEADVPPRPEPEDPDVTPRVLRMKYAGQRQFDHAWALFENVENHNLVTGPIGYSHHFVDVHVENVPHLNESSGEVENVSLCKAAMGVAYFREFDPEGELWEIIRDLIKVPSEEMTECQLPKGIMIAGGEMDEPWAWLPRIFAVQYFQIGTVSLLGLPGEFTTMAGRRVQRAVKNVTESTVILAGLCNNYINYVTTPEEYDYQAFEGGATIFGKNTVPLVTYWMIEMAKAVKENDPDRIPSGPSPPSFLDLLRTEVVPAPDPLPPLKFGSIIRDAEPEYDSATDIEISVVFSAGSPRNSGLRRGTFFIVEKKIEITGRWGVWRTDADVDTLFHWRGPEIREVEVRWFLSPDMEPGTYRIRHFGYYKLTVDGNMHNYEGKSREFLVK
ncbi:neutral ceramidase [Folsomia candida]|uniref:Neutral ceramidase n=1 Tax=Folsomia candida TaxID=158441 RepID=A0A226DRR2_FOLCA|nr:neutral ceramidase [Folsomia candida]OXA48192.1 Neutral ceramidase [Folsomia candida]